MSAISSASLALRQDSHRRTLSVASIPSIAIRWLVPALEDFSRKCPDISIQVMFARSLEQFDPERCDVLITHLKLATRGLSNRRLFTRANKPVASRHYLANHRYVGQDRLDGAWLLHDETAES